MRGSCPQRAGRFGDPGDCGTPPAEAEPGEVYTDYGGQIDKTFFNDLARGAGNVGLALGTPGFFPAMDVLRQALPMVLSLLKMALVICIPMVLVIGTYDLKVLMTSSCVFFALYFVDFWFQLARWIDSTILDALYGWGWGGTAR